MTEDLGSLSDFVFFRIVLRHLVPLVNHFEQVSQSLTHVTTIGLVPAIWKSYQKLHIAADQVCRAQLH
jgi:hypothetical protein